MALDKAAIFIKIGDLDEHATHGDIADIIIEEEWGKSLEEIIGDNNYKIYGCLEVTPEEARYVRSLNIPPTDWDLQEPYIPKKKFDIEKLKEKIHKDIEKQWKSKDVVPRKKLKITEDLFKDHDGIHGIEDTNSISSGLYTIGAVDASYASLLLFRNDIAATLTGDMTGLVIGDSSTFATTYLNAKFLNDYTLLIDNTIERRGNPTLGNRIIFDATDAPFQGIYLRQDSSSTLGQSRFIIRNQHFQMLHGIRPSGGQSSDIYQRVITHRVNFYIHDNIHDSTDSPDGSSWYAHWYVGDNATVANAYIYNNIFRGYNYSTIGQNGSAYWVYLDNNLFTEAYNPYATVYFTKTAVMNNNVAAYRHIGLGSQYPMYFNNATYPDSTGSGNIATGFIYFSDGGTNDQTVNLNSAFESLNFGDANYAVPRSDSVVLHRGYAPSILEHDRYTDGLPMLPGDITAGPKSRRLMNLMATT